MFSILPSISLEVMYFCWHPMVGGSSPGRTVFFFSIYESEFFSGKICIVGLLLVCSDFAGLVDTSRLVLCCKCFFCHFK